MARSTSRFDRKKPSLKQQARILVICEDTKSSRIYLEDATRHFRAQAEIDIVHSGKNDPLNIVSEAVRRRRDFDKIYCVIDRDRHEGFDQALRLANANAAQVVVIASYPCYEYWLLLHFCKTSKPYAAAGKNSSGDLLIKDLRKKDGMADYAKGGSKSIFDSLILMLPTARRHAAERMVEVIGDESLDPSTRLHELIELFEKLGKPQLVD